MPILIPSRFSWLVAVSVVSIGVSSCSLIRVNGKPLGSSSQPSPQRQSAAPSSATKTVSGSAPVAEPKPKPVAKPAGTSAGEIWQSIHYSHVKNGEYPSQFFTRTGLITLRDVTLIPKTVSSTWIPNWNRTSRAKRGAAFLASAVSRTWQIDCHKEFSRQQAAWKSILQDSRRDLELVASTKNFYLGRTRIEALWRSFSTRSKKEQLYLPKGHPLRWSFGWNALVRSELNLRKNTSNEKLAFWALPRELYEQTRPMPATEGVGREAFCKKSRDGTSRLPAEPSLGGAGGGSAPSASPEKYKQATQWLRSSRDWVGKNWKKARSYSIGQGFIPWQNGYEGRNIEISGLVVKKVSKRAEGATLQFVETRFQDHHSKCRRTNRVVQIHADGRVEYDQNCLVTRVKTALTMNISFPYLPIQGVQVGDSIWAYGTMNKKKITKKSTFKRVQSIQVTGLHISGIERKGQRIKLYP